VSTVSANAVPSGGGTVTISGLSFGSFSASVTASLTTADVCGSSAWTSATAVACVPQAYGGSAMRTGVSVSGVVGTLTGQFSFDGALRCTAPQRAAVWLLQADGACAGPVASTVSANAVPSGGGTVTVNGLSFGSFSASVTASLTTADVCCSSAWTSATAVACVPQAYGGSAMRTGVSVSRVVGTLMGQFSFDGAPAFMLPTASCAVQACVAT
jgi:hypothetical protein